MRTMASRVRRHVLVPENEMFRKVQLESIPAETKETVLVSKRMEDLLNVRQLPANVKAQLFGELLQRYQNLRKQVTTAAAQNPAIGKIFAETATQMDTNEKLSKYDSANASSELSHHHSQLDLTLPQDANDVARNEIEKEEDDAEAGSSHQNLVFKRAVPLSSDVSAYGPPTPELSVETIAKAMPSVCRTRGLDLATLLSNNSSSSGLSWNRTGELIVDGETKPGTRIIELVKYVVKPPAARAKSKMPPGITTFKKKLIQMNVPKRLVPTLSQISTPEDMMMMMKRTPKPSRSRKKGLQTPLQHGYGWIAYKIYKRR